MAYLRVALDVPLDRLFDYALPAGMAALPGQRVVVPFGRQRLVGLIIEINAEPSDAGLRIKPVEAVLDDLPPLQPDSLSLLQFCADYYQHPLGQVVYTAIPGRFREPAPFSVKPDCVYLAADAASLQAGVPKRATVQQQLAALLAQPADEASIRALSPSAWKLLQGWLAQGWVNTIPVPRAPLQAAEGPVLNADQQAAVAAIAATSGFQTWLLHGITGSGKTEVYLQAIAAQLAAGKQALVLVPEINLTPQLEGRFRARFPGVGIVSLHSGVADGERAAGWVRAARGEAAIVLGTRLAVFTPMPDLGLIVVDEEHDGSFKQQEGLRYSARDLAIYRAGRAGVPVVLGSATPSMETWHKAEQGRYRRLTLRQRAVQGARPPQLRLIPTRHQVLQDGLHPQALAAISERLARGEQSLIFLNRRGYAPVMHCGECGWMAACTRCSARLTVHLRERCLRCHHCGWEEAMTAACPGCGNRDLNPVGQGTQRLEAMLATRLPQARLLRIDRDSIRRKGSFEAALAQVHGGEADVLIGTQMLAKGHDFPKLTLVVVLGGDSGLYSADYRAGERLYALLTQVAGRAGRADLAGEVLVQTEFPEHPLYQALLADDYAAFAHNELGDRTLAGFPPFVHQAVLRAEAEQLDTALGFLQQALALAPVDEVVTVWDPVAAAMVRLANRERAQLLVQSGHRGRLQVFLRDWMATLRALPANTRIRWSLDVDPLDV